MATPESLLTTNDFERLLTTLDQDRDTAAREYSRLRDRVARLLHWWGASDSDDLADATLDRVARTLSRGKVVPRTSLSSYVQGVARMIFYESARAERRRLVSEQHASTYVRDPAADPMLDCLDACLEELEPAERDLVLRYYGNGRQHVLRRELAGELGISSTALRLRAHRVRERLEREVTALSQSRR
jgi:DNA-directed RNA polymerase specialized sigma24 family protein